MSVPAVERLTPYRADIDGLRALSVIAVILFHAGVGPFAGGFIGVDVFFVVSGYLITQWLRTRTAMPAPGALREFFLRRARRILPALALLLTVTAVVAYLWLLPADLVRFGLYLLAAVFMAGNVAAWIGGDYFNSAVGTAPLLHLWSIAVEEQFYLLFPLLMLALRRLPAPRQVAVLGALASISFALCVAGSWLHPVASFYAGITRAWELLLGAVLVYGPLDGLARRHAAAMSAGGLVAMILAMVLYRRDLHHPGLVTLAPVLGAAAFIAAGRVCRTPAAKLLETRACVLTGQASYSLYLWHLPALVFATYIAVESPRGWRLAAIVIASVVVAFAAWAAFEQPLRRGQWLRAPRRFLTVAAVVFGLLALCGAGWYQSDGLPQRFSTAERRIIASADLHRDASRCMTLPLEEIAAGRLCSYGPQGDAIRSVVVWGDSHALALLPALESLGERQGMRVYFAGRSACRPLPGFRAAGRAPASQVACEEYNRAMSKTIARLRPDVVVLASFWAFPTADVLTDHGSTALPLDAALRTTVRALAGSTHRVCLVRNVPVMRHNVPQGLVMAQRRGIGNEFLSRRDADWETRQRIADQALLAVGRDPATIVVDPVSGLCGTDTCQVTQDGQAMFRDTHHLSVAGALQAVEPLGGCFDTPP